jgi:hypothetical protein
MTAKLLYGVGDKVWYIPYPKYAFAVLCTITEVDNDCGTYWVDEPIGHGLQDDELTPHLDIVICDLIDMVYEGLDENMTLDAFRDNQMNFIKKTWGNELHPGFSKYPYKSCNEDAPQWLNAEYIKKKYNYLMWNDE